MKIPVEFNALGELPDGWSWQPLQSLTANPKQDVVDGPFGSDLKASEYVSTGVPIARLQNIDRNAFITKNIRFLTPDKAADLARHEFRPDDILITKLGDPLGKACIVPASIGRGVIVADLVRVRPDEKLVDRKYLTYAINSPTLVKQFELHTKGTTRPRVNLSVLRQLPIPLAPREMQTEIVAEIEKQFSRLDEAVSNLLRVKANLNRYTDSVYAEVFGHEPNCTLGDLIEEGPQNGLYLPKEMYGEGVPILRIDDYQTAWIRPLAELRRVKATPDQIATWSLRESDLVINRVNSMTHLGKCALIPAALAGTVFESNMMRMRLKEDVLPKYVEHYLASRLGKTRLTENAKWAVNQASINQKDVQATPITLPGRGVQQLIVADIDRRLSIIKGTEIEVQANIRRAQALRRSVLSKSFVSP